MGSMRFVRDEFVEGSIFNIFSFDSEPRGTIARALGLWEPSVELTELPERESTRYKFYEVTGKQLETDRAARYRGEVRWEKTESMRERLQ